MLQAKKISRVGFNEITNETLLRFDVIDGYWEEADSLSQTLNCFDKLGVKHTHI